MNKFIFFIFLLFSLNLINLIYAQDAPKISFGSIYYTKGATVVPGSNFSYDIYFFVDSEYGDRTAHISFSLKEPEGWKVYIFPALKTNIYNISGILVNATENLYVEPRPKLQTIPEQKEEGIYYIASPSGKGYLQAKKVTVYVDVPSNVEIGKSYVISAVATANYFGDLGSISFSQSRGFDFTVTIKPPVYTEQIVNPSNNTTTQTNQSTNVSKEYEKNQTTQSELNQSEYNVSENQLTNYQIQPEENDLLNYVVIAVVAGLIVYFTMNYLNPNKKPYKNYKVKNEKKKEEDREKRG